ncbi:MAG: chemotaxis response regulator protein-glutamate methylesterase [Rhodobacteraceae bacterium]|nr:MAG: chemotaxis response regulator protein-glutamate methylesterase [Paracoccaceae bacterium]
MRAIRVLFVADGPHAGGASAAAVGADPAIDLVARAPDVETGADMALGLSPDVVLVYASAPSGPSRRALETTAAECGASVVIVEAARGGAESFDALRQRVKAAANGVRAADGVSASRAAGRRPARPARRPVAGASAKLIAIGASTGGVEALVQVLSGFPKNCPPTVVVQHMPPFFTTSFAARLNGVCHPTVHEAWDGAPLERGVIYLAPGGPAHLEVLWNPVRRIRLLETEPVNRHRPSVDVCFFSVAKNVGPGVIGVLLTGMGRDGADGLKAMREAGARTIAQDKDTSTVYGMPRAAIEIGAADRGTPLHLIAGAIFASEAALREAQ